jgi:hypothetical protein
MNINKILAYKSQQHTKNTFHNQINFIPGIQGSYKIHKSRHIIKHINRIKDKIRIIISIDAEKVFHKIQHPFKIKALKKLGTEGTFLTTSKVYT